MNTLRFFLLLISIFFFAYLFQIDAAKRTSLIEDVLSEKVSQDAVSMTSSSEEKGGTVTDLLSRYRYPGSIFVSRKKSLEELSSTDDVHKILKWYKSQLRTTSHHSLSMAGNEKKYRVTNSVGNKRVDVLLTESAKNSGVFITISITAS